MQPRWVNVKCFYVYVDWTTEEKPRPYYVGKGDIRRVRSLKRNRHHTHVAKHLGQYRQIIFECDDEIAALDFEVHTIRKLDTYNPSYRLSLDDIRCNKTKGGEGASGFKLSKPRAAISDKTRQRLSASHVGKNFTDDHKQKLSESAKRREPKSDETCDKISVSKRGVPNTKLRKKVAKCDCDGNVIDTFPSLTSASKMTGIPGSGISAAANGHIESYKGFRWAFLP